MFPVSKAGVHGWNGFKGGCASFVPHWIRWGLERWLQPCPGIATSCLLLRSFQGLLHLWSCCCSVTRPMLSRDRLACLVLGIHWLCNLNTYLWSHNKLLELLCLFQQIQVIRIIVEMQHKNGKTVLSVQTNPSPACPVNLFNYLSYFYDLSVTVYVGNVFWVSWVLWHFIVALLHICTLS